MFPAKRPRSNIRWFINGVTAAKIEIRTAYTIMAAIIREYGFKSLKTDFVFIKYLPLHCLIVTVFIL